MDSSNPNDILDSEETEKPQTREERIRKYAQSWYEFRLIGKIPGSAAGDWAKAEHVVDAEDRNNDRK